LVAYDFAGKLLWHYPLPGFDTMWGTASSPIFYCDSVILVQDQNRAPSLFIAIDKHSGKLLWKHERPKAMGWATPQIVRVDNHDELIYAGGERVAEDEDAEPFGFELPLDASERLRAALASQPREGRRQPARGRVRCRLRPGPRGATSGGGATRHGAADRQRPHRKRQMILALDVGNSQVFGGVFDAS
jgi:hypothetical protein